MTTRILLCSFVDENQPVRIIMCDTGWELMKGNQHAILSNKIKNSKALDWEVTNIWVDSEMNLVIEVA